MPDDAQDQYGTGGFLPPGVADARNDTDVPEPVITCAGGITLPTIGAGDGE